MYNLSIKKNDRRASESVEYYDYINKEFFYADDYCPEKYEQCIKVVDYIIKKCNISDLESTKIKFFKPEDRDKIMQSLIDKEINDYGFKHNYLLDEGDYWYGR